MTFSPSYENNLSPILIFDLLEMFSINPPYPHRGHTEPMFSVQTGMLETEKKV